MEIKSRIEKKICIKMSNLKQSLSFGWTGAKLLANQRLKKRAPDLCHSAAAALFEHNYHKKKREKKTSLK